jgi:DNA-binding IclR family transcriptional regulator
MGQAYALVGSHATVVAAAGSGPAHPSVGVKMSTSLVATAAGQAIAAQLDPSTLERVLPKEPFPDPVAELMANPGYVAFSSGRFASAEAVGGAAPSVPGDREQLGQRLEAVRENGYAIDAGDLHPQIGCIAVPWPGTSVTAALACMGTPTEISESAERTRLVLQAAARPTATLEDVVAAAATGRHYSVAP